MVAVSLLMEVNVACYCLYHVSYFVIFLFQLSNAFFYKAFSNTCLCLWPSSNIANALVTIIIFIKITTWLMKLSFVLSFVYNFTANEIVIIF